MGFRPGVAFKLTAQVKQIFLHVCESNSRENTCTKMLERQILSLQAFQKYADQAAKDDELRNKLLNLENVHHDQQGKFSASLRIILVQRCVVGISFCQR